MNKADIINLQILEKKKIVNLKRNKYIHNKNRLKTFCIINPKVIKSFNKTLFLIIVLGSLLKISNQRRINFGSSYIILKTNITGNVKILNDNYFNSQIKPSKIWINDKNKSEILNEYCLDESNTIIKMYFDDDPITASNMFRDCSNLTEIDLSNFDTSKITNMNSMFQGCTSLHSINLSNIDTSSVENMANMFNECSFLISLDLSSFNTSKVQSFNGMFSSCSCLISLDLSSFDPSNALSMNFMFKDCTSLKSLNLTNFQATKGPYITQLFFGCWNLEFINFENAYLDFSRGENIYGSNTDKLKVCSRNFNFTQMFSKNILVNCANKIYEEDNKVICYSNHDIHNNAFSCDICGENFHQLYNDENNSNSIINCYESLKYKCKFNYYYNLTSNIFYCTDNEICPQDYNKFIEEKRMCIDECDKDPLYKYELNKICYNKSMFEILNNTKNDIDLYNSELIEVQKNESKAEQIDNMINELLSGFNGNDINQGRDKKKTIGNDIVIILTSTQNQKINENISNITMNLGECEDLLKDDNNISKNDSLYILQIISEEEGMKIPKIEYEVYYPLHGNNNLTKLDLSICKDTKIEISIAVKINDKIDKYNLSSNYYNDICSKTTSESGTDISLKDRRNEFVDNNMSLCEENCELIDYNYNSEKAKCSCDIKLSIPPNYEIKFNKKDYFKSFIDVKNIFNLNIMKCYKTVLRINSLLHNHGFLIIGYIMIIYLISLIIFLIISYNKLKKEIFQIFTALNQTEINIIFNHVQKKQNKKNKMKTKSSSNKTNLKFSKKEKKKNEKYCRDISNQKIRIETIGSNNKINIFIKKILKKKYFELNALNYKSAIKLDHRNYCEYYFSLLKNDHPILFSFGSYNDYNSKIIKMFLFFFSFSLDFTVNALFFTDDTMHKIYEDKGKFNILYQIPQTLYSTIISRTIDFVIKNFALSQDCIVDFKQEKNKMNLKRKHQKLLRIIKIKFILFYIFSFIILVLFWYYITCFCGIYINTQSHLIKDSLISLLTSFIYPFVIDIIPGIFRIVALRVGKPSCNCIYKFSQFIS